jgi:hypothetical protein
MGLGVTITEWGDQDKGLGIRGENMALERSKPHTTWITDVVVREVVAQGELSAVFSEAPW